MKVYVDGELPEDCKDCCFWRGCCCLFDTANCPLIDGSLKYENLTDYAKQVRKEVCEEIQAKIEEKARYSINNNDGWDILIDENSFLEILDKIQGERDES